MRKIICYFHGMNKLREVFKSLAYSQQELISQLKQVKVQRGTSKQNGDNNLINTTLIPFKQFDEKKEKFGQYQDRFAHYLKLMNASNLKQIVYLLLVFIGCEHHRNLLVQLQDNQ